MTARIPPARHPPPGPAIAATATRQVMTDLKFAALRLQAGLDEIRHGCETACLEEALAAFGLAASHAQEVIALAERATTLASMGRGPAPNAQILAFDAARRARGG